MPGPYGFTVVSINGVNINAGNYKSYFDADDPGPFRASRAVDTITAAIAGRGDLAVRTQPKKSRWILTVELASFLQDDLDAFYRVFDESLGSVFLRGTDGNGTTWRASVQLMGQLLRDNPGRFKVPMECASGVFEEDTATSNTQSAINTSPKAFTLTNNGSRPARPKFTIVPNTVKASAYDDYKYSLRGVVVNRAIRNWSRLPVYLCDVNGSASRINMASLLSTAFSPAATLSGALTSSATSIPVAAGTPLTVPTSGMILIVTGGVYEQITYSGVTNNGTTLVTLTGCVRGAGGTTAAAHNNGDAVTKSEVLFNGDDIRVWMNGAEIERYLVGFPVTTPAASLDVVCNLSMPAVVALSPIVQPTGSTPANGGSLEFAEGVRDLPPAGFIVTTGNGIEVMQYTGKSGKAITGIVRACWGTSAVDQTGAGNPSTYGNPLLYVIACGKATAGKPPADSRRRPAIQLPASNNVTWRWGDEADDASTIFFDRDNPDRSAQWTPLFELDGNANPPKLSVIQSKTAITFKDDDPGDGNPPYNAIEIAIPQGLRQTSGTPITADWSAHSPDVKALNLEMWLRDINGTYKLVDQLQQAAAAAGRNAPAATTKPYGIKLKARNNVATGLDDQGSSVAISNAADNTVSDGIAAVRFIVDQTIRLDHILCVMAMAAGGPQNVKCTIHEDSTTGTPPSEIPEEGDPGLIYQSEGSVAVTGTTPATYKFPFNNVPRILAPGAYWLVVRRGATIGANNVLWYAAAASGFGPRRMRGGTRAAGVWNVTIGTPDFKICTAYGNDGSAPIQSDQPLRVLSSGARTGETAGFDKVIANISGFNPYPAVHRTGGFTNGLYHCTEVIRNTTSGDAITVDWWMPTGSSLAIDCDLRTVIYTEGLAVMNVPRCITPATLNDWLRLLAGSNAMTITEPNVASTDFTSLYRGVKP